MTRSHDYNTEINETWLETKRNVHSGKELSIQFPSIDHADESSQRTALYIVLFEFDLYHLIRSGYKVESTDVQSATGSRVGVESFLSLDKDTLCNLACKQGVRVTGLTR